MKISPPLFDGLEKLRINDSIKMKAEGDFFPSQCVRQALVLVKVSAVAVKLITFQCFDKIKHAVLFSV